MQQLMLSKSLDTLWLCLFQPTSRCVHILDEHAAEIIERYVDPQDDLVLNNVKRYAMEHRLSNSIQIDHS